VKLYVSNTTTKVVGTSDERSWLHEYLSFPNPKAHFSGGDKKQRYFNQYNSTFHTGFLPMVKKSCEFELDISDDRQVPARVDEDADLNWLRPYQLEAVDKITELGRGILWLPTGSGKTEIATGIVKSVPDANWLFLVHKSQLMEQAADRYEMRTGLKAGRIGEGRWSIEKYTCATFQTLYAGLKRGDPRTLATLKHAEGAIVDECHTLPANSFWQVLGHMHRAYYRVGLSGTPLARDDSKSLNAIALVGPVIYRVLPETLIEGGVLAKPTICMAKSPVRGAYKEKAQGWQATYKNDVVRSADRNAVVVRCAKQAEYPALVFVKDISHGKNLTKLLGQAGIKAEFVWGDHSTEYRTSLLRRLSGGHLDVLVCSTVFNEGVDIPDLRSVVIAAGGKSAIAAIQRIGRGMRVVPGKSTFQVFDIMDVGCGCADIAKQYGSGDVGTHPGCRWLEKHSKARVQAYQNEGFKTSSMTVKP
jgi:superfamily II DNA or RNA helicase